MTVPKQQILSEISNAACNGYAFYVYTLADTAGVFYVGKGTKGRVFTHQMLPKNDQNTQKQSRIRVAGMALQHVVLAYFIDETAAYEYESILISEMDGLTNIAGAGYLAPIERARIRSQAILDALPPFKAFSDNIRFLWIGPGKATPKQAYDRLVQELQSMIENPVPTSMTLDHHGKLVSVGYNGQSAEVPPPAWLTARAA